LGKNVISDTIITSKNIGDKISLLILYCISNSKEDNFQYVYIFALTLNKNPGQLLSKVGFYLSQPTFTHGQLYLAISRVKIKKRLKDGNKNVTTTTTNMVYK